MRGEQYGFVFEALAGIDADGKVLQLLCRADLKPGVYRCLFSAGFLIVKYRVAAVYTSAVLYKSISEQSHKSISLHFRIGLCRCSTDKRSLFVVSVVGKDAVDILISRIKVIHVVKLHRGFSGTSEDRSGGG